MEDKENLNSSTLEYEEMRDKKAQISARQRRKLLSALGFGILVFGLYLLFVFVGIIPFSSRFTNILSTKTQIITISVICLVLGGAINETIRKAVRAIFQE